MWCVVPIAGRGTRLRPLTAERPKALIRIGERTLLERLLDRVTPALTNICLIHNPDDTLTSRVIGDVYQGIPVSYVTQPEPLGVADAVAYAHPFVQGDFIVLMGDVYYDTSLVPAIKRWRQSGAAGAVLIEHADGPSRDPVGIVDLQAERVIGIRKAQYVPNDDTRTARICGMFILPAAAFEEWSELEPTATGEYEIEAIVARLMDRGYTFAAIPYAGWRRNINTPGDLRDVERRLDLTE